MPLFDGSSAGNPWLLAAAATLLGVSVALFVWLVTQVMRSGAFEPMVGVIDEAQRRLRREQGQRSSSLFALVLAILPLVTRYTSRMPLEQVKKDLSGKYARAGWPGGLSDDELVGLSVMLGVVMAVVLTLVGLLVEPMYAPAGLIGVLLGPGIVSNDLSSRARVREVNISRVMPFVLDLLVLTLRAGASLTMAMDRIATDYQKHPMGEEFRAVLSDIEMGVTTLDAFRGLALRVPIGSVRAFVDELIQSEELGRPIADTLARLAERGRYRRVQEANIVAGKAKVMVLVPSILVLMGSLVMLFAPFAVKFYYGGFSEEAL